VGVEPVTS